MSDNDQKDDELVESALFTDEDPVDPKYAKMISAHATQSEKTSWKRKQSRLESIINNTINPINAEIAYLHSILEESLVEMNEVKTEMVETCIHPYEYLVLHREEGGNIVECKFCEKRLKVVNRE